MYAFLRNDQNYPENFQMKIHMIVAVHGFLRTSECLELMYDDIKVMDDVVVMTLFRKKSTGPRQPFNVIISDTDCTSLLKRYLMMFPDEVSFMMNYNCDAL